MARGTVILCALDIFACIKNTGAVKKAEGDGENAAMNTFDLSRRNKTNIVGQQFFIKSLKIKW